jgi:predicted DNA-binding WGR domain protein
VRRFELVQAGSSKFWEIEVRGSTYHVRFGRIGTAGQQQTKDLGSAASAQAAAGKKIGEKLRHGYAEVPGVARSRKRTAATSSQPSMDLAAWCERVVRAAGDRDEAFLAHAPPARPLGARSAEVLVQAVADVLRRLAADNADVGYGRALELLLETLVGSEENRPFLQPHGRQLVARLSGWGDDAERGTACLAALAWLDTAESLRHAIRRVIEVFSRRETGGHERIIDAVSRATPHIGILFPALVAVFERQAAHELAWDRWHVTTAAAIVRLAHDLRGAGSLVASPWTPVRDELAMLVRGSDRVCAPLTNAQRKEFEWAVRDAAGPRAIRANARPR